MKLTLKDANGAPLAVADGAEFAPETQLGDLEDMFNMPPAASPGERITRDIDFCLRVLQRTDARVTREHIRSMRPHDLGKLAALLVREPEEAAAAALE